MFLFLLILLLLFLILLLFLLLLILLLLLLLRLLLLLHLLRLALRTLVGFGLLYHFVPQSSIYTILSPVLTFISFKSSSTCSSHLSLGLPTGLDEHGSHSVSFLTVHIGSVLIT